jgi:hypothetical protein
MQRRPIVQRIDGRRPSLGDRRAPGFFGDQARLDGPDLRLPEPALPSPSHLRARRWSVASLKAWGVVTSRRAASSEATPRVTANDLVQGAAACFGKPSSEGALDLAVVLEDAPPRPAPVSSETRTGASGRGAECGGSGMVSFGAGMIRLVKLWLALLPGSRSLRWPVTRPRRLRHEEIKRV